MNTFYLIISLSLYYTIICTIQYSLEEDKIFILIGEEAFLINLIKNSITKELISLLPLKTKLLVENESEINLTLSIEIETETFPNNNNDIIKANMGDLFLVKGQKKLIIFNESKTFINNNGEYFKIGNTDQSNKIIKFIPKNRNKSSTLLNTLNYADHKGKIKPYTYTLMNYITWKIFTFFCFLFL